MLLFSLMLKSQFGIDINIASIVLTFRVTLSDFQYFSFNSSFNLNFDCFHYSHLTTWRETQATEFSKPITVNIIYVPKSLECIYKHAHTHTQIYILSQFIRV